MWMTQRQLQLIEAQIGAISDGARGLGFSMAHMAPSIEPAQDFHRFAGGGWLDQTAFLGGSIAGIPRRVCPSIPETR